MLVIVGLILSSGLGITPEREHWNLAGIPLTSLQLSGILLSGVVVFGLMGLIMPRLLISSASALDGIIILVLLVGTILLWMNTPIPHNELATRPVAPTYQVFPASDARVYDLGALSVLKGFGILFRIYIDKPLYCPFAEMNLTFVNYPQAENRWWATAQAIPEFGFAEYSTELYAEQVPGWARVR